MLLIKNIRLVNPATDFDGITDILIDGTKIKKLESGIKSDEATVIDGTNLVAAPGIVDLHVHLREPGQTHKEDIFTASCAAVAGGVTSLLAMPNTTPAVDNVDTLKQILEKAKNAKCHIYQTAAISHDLMGEEKTDLKALREAGAAAFSDDGRPTLNSKYLAEAMIEAEKLGSIVCTHSEDLYISKGGAINEGKVSEKLGLPGVHRGAENLGTAREIALAESYDAPVHICHISTKEGMAMIRDAKKRGVKVSCETAPHYFTFTDENCMSGDACFKMNPPLRTEKDRLAIIGGIVDGTVDCIATDHAPHTDEEKKDLKTSMNGVIGMEQSFASSYTNLVCKNIISLNRLIELMSVNPAKILKIEAGDVSVGKEADLVIFSLDETTFVDVNKLHGKSKNAIFKGQTLNSKVHYTIVSGEIAYDSNKD